MDLPLKQEVAPELTWRRRAQALNRQAVRIQTTRDQLQTDLAARRLEVQRLTSQIDRLIKAGELLRLLMDKLVLDQVKTIEGIVTEGLRAIFFDQDLSFETEVSQKYNRISIDFFLRQGDQAMAVRGPPLESFGGGPSSIASLILRLLALMRLKRAPILLLDETLAAVSDDYIDAAGQFLQKLATTTGIDLLLVTHKQAFLDHATMAYQGLALTSEDEGSWSLGLRRMRGGK